MIRFADEVVQLFASFQNGLDRVVLQRKNIQMLTENQVPTGFHTTLRYLETK